MSEDAELGYLSATAAVSAYRRKQLSPVEVTAAALARVERLDATVNAFCLLDRDGARASAAAAERRWQRGAPQGLLDGVPVSVKDLLLTRGWPTLRGSRAIDPDQDWSEDAPSVARLREHGAVILGKTTTPELGWKGVTDSPLTGVTRNPWNTALTSGGSSGGSAAAVALGMGALSIGTDGGGSVRIPAAFCGVFGLKATYGRVPLYPPSPFGTLAHVGPMTRTVEDAALLLDVLAQPDPRDWSALPPPTSSYQASLERGVAGLRVAFSPTLGYVQVHPDVARAVRVAGSVLESLGADVEEVDPGFEDPVGAFHVLWFSGAAQSVGSLPESARAGIDPGLREIAQQGRALTAADYLEATATRMALGVRMGRFHETYDLLVTPALPIPAFPAGVESPDMAGPTRWTSWTPFSYPFNLTQQPAASVPCGHTRDGLPVGLQVVGARHADALVLAACRAYQDAAGWDMRPPDP